MDTADEGRSARRAGALFTSRGGVGGSGVDRPLSGQSREVALSAVTDGVWSPPLFTTGNQSAEQDGG